MQTPEVLYANQLATQLILWESRGPGDLDNAMRRVARRHGIDYGSLWSLRYRSPKRIWADVLSAISAAYEAERQRQIRKLEHDIAITEAITGAGCASVVAARSVLHADAGETLAQVARGPAMADERGCA